MEDADFMLSLKNDEQTRRFSIVSQEIIKREDHLKWLEENIQYFRIIEDREEKLVGAIRIQNNEVSIWIAREYWKMGIATFVLQHECDRSHYCKIVEGNIGSMKVFIRAGFLPVEYISVNKPAYYIFKK